MNERSKPWSAAVETNVIAWGFVREDGEKVESGQLVINVDGSISVLVDDGYYTGTIDRVTAEGLWRVLLMRLESEESKMKCSVCGHEHVAAEKCGAVLHSWLSHKKTGVTQGEEVCNCDTVRLQPGIHRCDAMRGVEEFFQHFAGVMDGLAVAATAPITMSLTRMTSGRAEYPDHLGDQFCHWSIKHGWWCSPNHPALRLMRRAWLPSDDVRIVADSGYAFRVAWWMIQLRDPSPPQHATQVFDLYYDVEDDPMWARRVF